MALKLFWRCEGTTLDGTHDYSAGDTTAAASGAVSLGTGGAKVGTNGIVSTADGDHYTFDNSTEVLNRFEGAVGMWLRFSTWGQPAGPFYARGASYQNALFILRSGNNVRLTVNEDVNSSLLTTSGSVLDGAESDWLFIVIRWDQPGSRRAVEVYDESMTLLDSATSTAAFTAPAADFTEFRFGGAYGEVVGHVDNIFIADDYDEPLQDFADITSYTEYGVAPSKSLGLLLRGCG